MADWSTLKSAIRSAIKANSNQEITGALLQGALLSIVTAVGENATFAGFAKTNTNPGNPDGPVFYLATLAGVYSNFNRLVVDENEAAILYWKGGLWQKVGGLGTLSSITAEIDRAKKAEAALQEKIKLLEELLASGGGEGGEGSSEVTRKEFELVKAESANTFKAFSDLGMTEETELDGYKIALNKSSNTAEKTSVKIPVYDTENPAVHPVGLVDEVFVDDMKTMMDDKIGKALEDYIPEDGAGAGPGELADLSNRLTRAEEQITNLADASQITSQTIALMSNKILALENSVVYLTKTEYQELVDAGKIDQSVEYNIYED